jgi:hypothetical protein
MPGRGSLGIQPAKRRSPEPWPGSDSWGYEANAGAVAIRVSGEGAIDAPLQIPPHPSP